MWNDPRSPTWGDGGERNACSRSRQGGVGGTGPSDKACFTAHRTGFMPDIFLTRSDISVKKWRSVRFPGRESYF